MLRESEERIEVLFLLIIIIMRITLTLDLLQHPQQQLFRKDESHAYKKWATIQGILMMMMIKIKVSP